MPRTLCSDLKSAENVNLNLDGLIKTYNDDLKDLLRFPRFYQEFLVKEPGDHSTPIRVDPKELQIKLFKSYKGNLVLQRAIDGEKSVYETLEDLIATNRTWHQWFPKKRDPELNAEVEALSDLIGDIDFLKTRWKYAWDNAFTGAVYGAGMSLSAIFVASLPFTVAMQEQPVRAYYAKGVIYLAAAVLGPLVGGWYGSNQRHQKNKHRAEAKYIDKKIEELLPLLSFK